MPNTRLEHIAERIRRGEDLTTDDKRVAVEWDETFGEVYGPLGSYDVKSLIESFKYESFADMRRQQGKNGNGGPVQLTPGEKAAQTRKRRQAAKKAAITRKRRAAGKKAALTKKRRAAAKKAVLTRKSRQFGTGQS